MAYVRKTSRKVRENAGKQRGSYKPRAKSPARARSPRKMTAPLPMGRKMMRKEPSKCEKALMNGTLQQTGQGKLVRVYRGKDGKLKKAYCAANLQRRGAMGAVNGNRLRKYVKGGSLRVSKKVAGMRKAPSACERAYRNGTLTRSKTGKLYRMSKTKSGGMRKVPCNANLTRRGVNTRLYGNGPTRLPNITNRLRVVSPGRSASSATTTASNIAFMNNLARALNMVPIASPTRSPMPSPVRKSPSPVNLEAKLRANGFGKHSKKVAAMMRANPSRKASNFSKQTGKLKVNVVRKEKAAKAKAAKK